MDTGRIIFGCEPLGGYQWGKINFDMITEAIIMASEHNVIYDTAETYGPYVSEERIGEIFRSLGKKPKIHTKFGIYLEEGSVVYDSSSDRMWRSIEGSLERLGIDKIDYYSLHQWDRITPLGSVLESLHHAVEQKLVGSVGICNLNFCELNKIRFGNYPSLSFISDELNVTNICEKQPQLDLLIENNVNYFAYGVLAQGMLTGKYAASHRFEDNDRRRNEKYKNFHGEKLMKNLKIVDSLRKESENSNFSITQICIQKMLDYSDIIYPICGIKSVAQFKENYFLTS